MRTRLFSVAAILVLVGCGTATANVPTKDYSTASPVAESTHAPAVAEITYNSYPVYIFPDVHSAWNVEEALKIWNEALGCDYFYIIEEKSDARFFIEQFNDPEQVWGLTYGSTIELNAADLGDTEYWSGPHITVTLHEIGHWLLLEHSEAVADVMYSGYDVVPYLPTQLSDNDLTQLAETGYTYCER